MRQFDVIVIGAGHAGCEAAAAAGRAGARCALITLRLDRIAALSCNPAIGGIAKGQIVREVDALGGLIARATDATGIQFRMLNRSKGPAVQSPRAQVDKYAYAEWMRAELERQPNVSLIAGEAVAVLTEPLAGGQSPAARRVVGVQLSDGRRFACRAVVVTTGTFLDGLMHCGELKTTGGRLAEPAAVGLSDSLRRAGLEVARLKTGTCPRLARESIDFSALQLQPGDDEPQPFSFLTPRLELTQSPCWVTWTNPAVHELIRANLHRAPMFSGQITSRGPRYCPSIEDKVVRFADKAAHQVFLEPESLRTNEIYCNGIPTSLPIDVQDRLVHSIPGLERARVLRWGYAIEYDFVPPTQMAATLETHCCEGLLLAGQINGTSGYEEAAGQGVVAGVNAARRAAGLPLVTLGRDQAYIGVMIDDLVTKGADEPYRMFTSRAEHRLLLRSDNADRRLTPLAGQWGLADPSRLARLADKQRAIDELLALLGRVHHNEKDGHSLLRRQDVTLAELMSRHPDLAGRAGSFGDDVVRQVEIEVKYSGYIAMSRRQIERFRRMEDRLIPANLDFRAVPQLRNEAKDRFSRYRPRSLGQAGRITGIHPTDLAVLLLHLNRPRTG